MKQKQQQKNARTQCDSGIETRTAQMSNFLR